MSGSRWKAHRVLDLYAQLAVSDTTRAERLTRGRFWSAMPRHSSTHLQAKVFISPFVVPSSPPKPSTPHLQARDTGPSSLRSYDQARHKELLPRYRLCDLVQRVVHSPVLLAWASERLRRSEDLTRLLLSTVGDQAAPRDLYSFQGLRFTLASF